MLLDSEKNWSTVQAKTKFADLVNSSKYTPQVITNYGKPVAVMVSIKEWQNKMRRSESLVNFFRNSPLYGENLNLSRIKDDCRDISDSYPSFKLRSKG